VTERYTGDLLTLLVLLVVPGFHLAYGWLAGGRAAPGAGRGGSVGGDGPRRAVPRPERRGCGPASRLSAWRFSCSGAVSRRSRWPWSTSGCSRPSYPTAAAAATTHSNPTWPAGSA